MSHFLDRLTYFTREREPFADGFGVVTEETPVSYTHLTLPTNREV